jgi:DNA-binding SARP family transcriptional activator
MNRLLLSLFGGFEARPAPGVPPVPLGRKAQALMAYLAVRPGTAHSRDKLAALLWSGMGDEQARHSVRQALFAIRRALPSAGFLTAGETVALDPELVEVDVALFERLTREATAEALRQALQLYRGDLLEGLRLREAPFESWLAGERERFRTRAREAMDTLVELQMKAGELEPAIQTAQRLLALDPASERAHRTLIRLYLAGGQRAAALRQYRTCVRILERELGVVPDAETCALGASIAEEGRAPAERPATREPGQRAAVLVVEDEPVTRALLEAFLASADLEVTAVPDGADALFRLSRDRFDVIVSDIAMPTLDGLTLLEVLARNHVHTPVIFVTGQPGEELEVKSLELGAVDYIRKPVQKEVLLLRVRRALQARGQ